ncbi:hypothetical protein AB0F18_17530 [Streptomyces sp. NPDC029216]|uniref:hypothetical protein n=1 Tax=Streptomyces sp. NPDC029216 TaxID=3154701 RepID=UPI003405253B
MDTPTALVIGQLTDYLRGLTQRLDPGAGWYGEFLRRDPEGMRACLDGIAVPPWDVLESLLLDLPGGPGAAAEEAAHAARLRAAAVAAWDAQPGGVRELRILLAAAAEQRAALEDALRNLTDRLGAAAGPAEAEALSRELAWTRDDAARATARQTDLESRLATLTLPAVPRQRTPHPLPDPPGGGATSPAGAPAPGAWPGALMGRPERTGGGGEASAGWLGGPSESRPGPTEVSVSRAESPVGRAEGRWLRGARRVGGARYAAPAPPPDLAAPTLPAPAFHTPRGARFGWTPAAEPGSTRSARPDASPGTPAGAPSDGRPEPAEGVFGPADTAPAAAVLDRPPAEVARRRRVFTRPAAAGPDAPAGDPEGAPSGWLFTGSAGSGTTTGDAPAAPIPDPQPGSSREAWPGAPADGSAAVAGGLAQAGSDAYPGGDGAAWFRGPVGGSAAAVGAPAQVGSDVVPRGDGDAWSGVSGGGSVAVVGALAQAGSDVVPGGEREAWLDGPGGGSAAAVGAPAQVGSDVVPGGDEAAWSGGPVGGSAAAVGAPAQVGSDVVPGGGRGAWSGAPVGGSAAAVGAPAQGGVDVVTGDIPGLPRGAARGAFVAELLTLRAQGRSGEAHALLCEAALWPAGELPGLAEELGHAGLAADWATLLWEAASLPPERLAAAAGALGEAGRVADSDRLLRQGVARPAGEVAEAALALGDAGRDREAQALLGAFVRLRTAEEAAALARHDPHWFAPRLLRAARALSAARHRDLSHALRVAGLQAT